MKKSYCLIALLVAVNIGLALFSCTKATEKELAKAEEVIKPDYDSLYQAAVYGKGGAPDCYSGGKGKSSCKTESGIDINGRGDLTIECSVTCDSGYYACCSYECHCIPASEWEK